MLKLRRTTVVIEDKRQEAKRDTNVPLRKVAVVAVVENPFANRFVEDLQPLVDDSVALGEQLAEMAVAALRPYAAQSYGKAAIVGLAGEQEHANALLTTAFAEPFRRAIGGGRAWISSMTKVAAPGALIDVPMNHKDEIYVRSHYDGMSLVLPETPMPDEVAVIFCLANRGRLNARVGGLTHEDVLRGNGERTPGS
jgi:hypothetical protein